jgi:hypothetical protein
MAELVCGTAWYADGLNYRAFVRNENGSFYFEGRIRLADGEHEFFPKTGCDSLYIGNQEKCEQFLRITLPSYGCPEWNTTNAISQVKKWK